MSPVIFLLDPEFSLTIFETSGYFSDSKGGCATVNLIGNFTDFLPRSAHGLTSIGFPTVFPLSLRFSTTASLNHCSDLRSEALALNILVTVIIFLVIRPRPVVLFWCMVCIGFWHITLFSQPRTYPPDIADGFGTFLPVLFVCYAFWRLAFRFVLPAFSKMPMEATILYLGPYWATVLANLTTERIPVDRLTAKDITAQRGGLAALIIIVLVLLVIAINQCRVIRQTGWLPYYLGWYLLGGLVALVLALLPTLQLRLHHYILAMILMPGTAFPTRLSAICQGFLLGLFLNGTAAFGFASILQTAAQVNGSLFSPAITNSANVPVRSCDEMAHSAPTSLVLSPIRRILIPPYPSRISRYSGLHFRVERAGMDSRCWWMTWNVMLAPVSTIL